MEETHEHITARLNDLRTDILDGFGEVYRRLDGVDARTRTVEQAVAVLEDRSLSGNRRSLLIGGSGGLISGAALIEIAKWIGVSFPIK